MKKYKFCVKCGKEQTKAKGLCNNCYYAYRKCFNLYGMNVADFLNFETTHYEHQSGKCIKCGEKGAKVKRMCRNCYTIFTYHRKANGISLEDYLSNNYNKIRGNHILGVSHNIKLSKEQLIKDYNELILTKKISMTDYCKENKISRQTVYDRLKRYKERGAL